MWQTFMSKEATAAAMTLQPVSSLGLLYAWPLRFSVFRFGFPISCPKQHDDILSHSIFPSFPVFSYPSLSVGCLLQFFLWYTMLMNFIYCSFNCSARTLNASGLSNGLTFHVPRFVSSCLYSSPCRAPFLSVIRGTS